MTGRRLALLLVLAPLLLAGWDSNERMPTAKGDRVLRARGGGTTYRDRPLLVPWSRIGDISLGELKTRVESRYGPEGRGFHVVQRYGNNVQGYYRLHGGRVSVTFYGGRVGELAFATPYYRTPSGFGVGSITPLGLCHKTATGRCEHRWHGFVFNAWFQAPSGAPCTCWVKVGLGAKSLHASPTNFLKPWFFIYTRRGRVTGFYFALKFVD